MTRIAGLYLKADEAKPLSALLNGRGIAYKFEFAGGDTYGLRVRTSDHCRAVTVVNAWEFHRHLDGCEHCRTHPFDLCSIGAAALQRAGIKLLKGEK